MPFPDLEPRLAEVKERIAAAARRGGHGQATTIIAVTKTHGPDVPAAAYEAGLADVGENKVQEALTKMSEVKVPLRWHMIGHLQRNKVNALEHFTLFHALDSSRLADAVDRLGAEQNRPVDVLIQVNPAGEKTKGGFDVSAIPVEATRLASMKGIRVLGAMTIARLGANETELRETFSAVRETRRILAEEGHPATELSMGMSGDYELAVEEGATMVRLGSVLFGERGR